MNLSAEYNDLLQQVSKAHATATPLRIRGGETKRFWASAEASRILDTRCYTGIVDYEPSELVITARTGTPLVTLEKTLEQNGQRLAFEPPHYGLQATVGGMIACGFTGPSQPVSGSMRQSVLGVRLIDGQGRDLRFGGQVIKNVAGFDVSRLMVGALGTLGLVTEVSLRVVPVAPHSLTLEWSFSEIEALNRLNDWGSQPWPVTASAYLNGRLRVRLEGHEPALRACHRALGGDPIVQPEHWWRSLREHQLSFFSMPRPLWRLHVRRTTPPLGLSGNTLIEWGGSQRWIVSDHTPAQLRQAAQVGGGYAIPFRTPGPENRREAFGYELTQIHTNIKQLFDPKGIFNPGLEGR